MTGPFILVLGLSGVALVFRAEIESLKSFTAVVASARQSAPSLDAIVAVARTRHPGAVPHALRIPSAPGWPYRVELLAGRQRLDIAVDPSTLRILGGRAAERSLMVAVRSLHAGLHGGRAGSLIVGLLGVWLVIESLTGLWLCWPSVRRLRAIGVVPTEGTGSRSLHRLVGGVSLVLGVIVALTGSLLVAASLLPLPLFETPRRQRYMYKPMSIFVVALALAVTTTAMAQTPEVTGRVVSVDPATQVIVLDNNQAFRVTPNTMLIVNGQPVAIGSLQPGQAVVIRSGEAVAMTPSTAAPAAQPGVAVQPSQPGSTVVVTQQPASAAHAHQTLYGRVTDVDRSEIRIKTDNGSFEVKVPRDLSSQVRKGDTVRMDLTFQP